MAAILNNKFWGNFIFEFWANSIWCTMVRSNLNAWFQRATLIPFINNCKNPIVLIFHTIILKIGKNNNVNLADFGAKFTVMSHSLYITVVNIGNVYCMCNVRPTSLIGIVRAVNYGRWDLEKSYKHTHTYAASLLFYIYYFKLYK